VPVTADRPAGTPSDDRDDPPTPEELDAVEALIDAWAARELDGNPVVEAVERDTSTGERRWFVRVTGEEKSVFSIWFHLRQRNLHVETYFMPAPEEDAGRLYEHLLRRNQHLHGLAFAIGHEDAVYVIGQHPVGSVDDQLLDHVLGSVYVVVEQCFRPAMRIGFASRFKG
jgi:hypothetical protein